MSRSTQDGGAGRGARLRGPLAGALLSACGLVLGAAPPPDDAGAELDANARELAAYEKALDEAIAERGPYNPELAETYQGFGRYLQQQGLHGDALAVLRKARHVTRINQGIHGAGQIPVLQGMIASLEATGQVTVTSDTYRELLRVADNGLAAEDPQRIALLRDAAHWHLAAHRLDAEEHRLAHLQAAHDLLAGAWELADHDTDANRTRAALLRDRALLHFRVLRERDSRNRAPQTPAGYRFTGDLADTGVRTLPASARAARELLDTRITLLEQEHPAAGVVLRRARLDRADWELMLGDVETATAAYRAWLSAATVSDREQLTRPEPLPAPRDRAGPSARIRVDVAADGRPDNIELLDSGPFADPEYRRRILRAVRETRFRPAFAEGHPVASTGAALAFPLVD